MNSIETRIWEYIRAAYPQGVRNDAWEVGSLTESYDQMRATLFASIEKAVEDGVAKLSLQTCWADGIELWEEFLWVAINPALPIAERRAKVISKLIGSHSTITNIRTVIESYIGTGSTWYRITEKWKISADVNDVWTYIISIYSKPLGYDETVFRTLIENIQPIHCVLEIEATPVIVDAIWITDSIDSYLHAPTVWLDWNSLPGSIPANEKWWSELTPLSGFIWS